MTANKPMKLVITIICLNIQVPPPHHPSTSYPLPQVVFRMFDYTDCPEGPILPGLHSIERYLIEEQLRHIFQTYQRERKDW